MVSVQFGPKTGLAILLKSPKLAHKKVSVFRIMPFSLLNDTGISIFILKSEYGTFPE